MLSGVTVTGPASPGVPPSDRPPPHDATAADIINATAVNPVNMPVLFDKRGLLYMQFGTYITGNCVFMNEYIHGLGLQIRFGNIEETAVFLIGVP